MLKRLLPLLILALGVAAFLWLRATRPESASVTAEERSWRVETLIAAPGPHAPMLPLYGEVTAPDALTVTAPLAGRIAARPVREGQRVDQGMLLVALDEADVQPALEQAEAQVAQRRAELANERVRLESDQAILARERQLRDTAQRQLERTRSLVGRNLASESDLDAARNELARMRVTVATRERAVNEHPARLERLEAALAEATAQLAAMRRDVQRSRAVAPFDAIVTRIQVAPGERVTAHSELLSVYPERGLELRARIPQRYQDELLDALADERQLAATAADGARFVLVGLAGQSDPGGTEAIFRLADGGQGLRPGGLLAVTLHRPAVPGSLPVPYSALYGSDALYVMDDEARMQRVPVSHLGEVVRDDGTRWALVSGAALEAGDRIITTHLPNAVRGLKVDPVEADDADAADAEARP